jgi:hypothetical protein
MARAFSTTLDVQSLGHQIAQLMSDVILSTRVVQRGRHGAGQSNVPVDLSQQHQTTV